MESNNVGAREVKRESWGSGFGFVMAAAASAIGLGNIWRFPYLAGDNGGGAFILIYLIAMVLIGFTVLLCEFIVGRGGQSNAIDSFRKLVPGSFWWIAGAFGVMAAFFIISFYIVVSGWTMAYVWMTLQGVFAGVPADQMRDIHVNFISDPILPLIWMTIFMALTVAIVAGGIKGGIEKASLYLLPPVVVILIIFMIRGLTLEGSMAGVSFLLSPDFSQITGTVVLVALGQAFFSLSLGMGVMITYGSYVKKQENIPVAARRVVVYDTAVAILAGFAVFPAVFAVGLAPEQGPGLVFIVLPAVFNTLPLGMFFGTLFFFLLAIAALTSAVSILEVLVAFVKERLNISRVTAALSVGFFFLLMGVTASLSWGPWSHILVPFPGVEGGLNLFGFYDRISSRILLPLAGLFTCLFVAWGWQYRNSVKEITNDGQLNFVWLPVFKIMVSFVAPIVIFLVLLNGLGVLEWVGGLINN